MGRVADANSVGKAIFVGFKSFLSRKNGRQIAVFSRPFPFFAMFVVFVRLLSHDTKAGPSIEPIFAMFKSNMKMEEAKSELAILAVFVHKRIRP